MSDRPLPLSFLTDRDGRAPIRGSGPDWLRRSAPPRTAARPSFVELVRLAWRRHRSRVMLAELDPHLLKDIGVTYAEAENEANKPFWHR
jgi:uncharacterized protein YjiS (DUF1127 family)